MPPAVTALAARAPQLLIAGGLALIATAFAWLLLEDGCSHVAEAGADHTVFVNNIGFCGTAGGNCGSNYGLQINTQETVVWLDGEAGLPHSVTQCTDNWAACPAQGGFDSGIQTDPPGSYTSQFFASEDTIYYQCQVHLSSMRGTITVGNAATPTASPTTPAPSATATASPAPTAAASPTATATTAPSPTATATPSATGRADVNCSGETDGDDVVALLLHRANNSSSGAAGNCQPIGSPEGDETKGDLNCDGTIDAHDAIIALRVWAGLSVEDFVPEDCPRP